MSEKGGKAKQIIGTAIRVAVGGGLLLYLGLSGAVHWGSLLGLASSWPITLLAFVLLFVALVLTSWRLCLLLEPSGFRLSLGASTRLTLIGVVFNNCLPGFAGGDVAKIYYANHGNRGRRTEVTTLMLLDRIAGMFALLVWPLLIPLAFPHTVHDIPILSELLWIDGAVVLAMIVGAAVATATPLMESRPVRWLTQRIPLGKYAARIMDTIYGYRHNWRRVISAVAISLVSHTIVVGTLLMCAETVAPGGAAWEMCVLVPFGFLANMLPVTPGGLGVGEAAFDQLFGFAGLSGGAETMLAWRLLMFAMGIPGLLYYLQGQRRVVHEQPHERQATATA
ncbi:MAG TPA: lysylphosphatidylglycerol synthase transmembrane domain-containing protein [Rhodothermales bacterium]